MRILLTTALALLVGATAVQFLAVPTADNDLWGHVLFGRQILSAGAVPASNGYAYTAPDREWINHEILAECAMAWTYDRFGSAGLLGLRLGLGLATLAVLAGIALRRGAAALATAMALVLATSLMSFGYLSRPQVFTFLFLAVLWDLIDRADRGASALPLWWGVPLIGLWVNTHGGVLAGLAILLIAAPFLASPSKRLTVALATLAAVGALLANPYGWKLPMFLARDVTLDRAISEWAPVPFFSLSNAQFKVTCIVVISGFIVIGIRQRPWEALIVVGAALAAFRHERHLPLFAVLSVPLLASTVEHGFSRIGFGRPSRGAELAIVVAALGLAVAQASGSYAVHRTLGFGIFVPREVFPVDAVRFIREHGNGGNLAVPFGWGEYALWHLHPAYRVSIDGRYTTAYPDDVIESAWRYMDGGPGWDRTLAGASLALTARSHKTALRLRTRPDWRLVYTDPTASVFARAGELPKAPESRTEAAPPATLAFFP